MRVLGRISALFPAVPLKGGPARSLKALGVDGRRYNAMALSCGAAAGIAAFLLPAGGPLTLPFALLAFAAAFGFVLLVPLLEARRRRAAMEAQMPLYLRSAGMFIGMGIPFRRALGMACGDDELGMEMRSALRGADCGMSLQKALGGIAITYGSTPMKRAVAQLIMAYESGASGGEIMRIGDDMMQAESGRSRELSARCAVFGLMFMMSSAIFPTFFLVYSIAGGAGQLSEPWKVRLAMLVVFPLISALILALSKASMPQAAGGGGLDLVLLAPGLALAAGFAVFPQYGAAIILACGVLGAALAAGHYRRERRTEEIERNLPDALLSVCGMPGSSGPEKVFGVMEEGGFGALSDEAAKSRRQLEMNNNLDAVLEDLWRRNRSPLLKRAAVMLGQMVSTHSLERMGMLADDMLRGFQAARERRALFAMQKYTLIAGSILIPLILGMALGLVAGIAGDSAAAAEAGALVPAYLVVYSVMAAIAIADGEGKGSSAAIYSVGLSAVSLVAFHFINF